MPHLAPSGGTASLGAGAGDAERSAETDSELLTEGVRAFTCLSVASEHTYPEGAARSVTAPMFGDSALRAYKTNHKPSDMPLLPPARAESKTPYLGGGPALVGRSGGGCFFNRCVRRRRQERVGG